MTWRDKKLCCFHFKKHFLYPSNFWELNTKIKKTDRGAGVKNNGIMTDVSGTVEMVIVAISQQ